MLFIRFHPDNFHEERCEFELFDKQRGKTTCGDKAIGQRGFQEGTRQYLCHEHFDYAVSLHGAKFEVRTERKADG
jgi:hypothetical protein